MPGETVTRLVRQDLDKEAALKRVYGVAITQTQLDAEVQRINATTRAPEILSELKVVLGNDPARFARSVAKPIVVERLLRERFDNDDKLHAAERRKVEETRKQLLSAKKGGADFDKLVALLKQSDSNALTEVSWQFGGRPGEAAEPTPDLVEIQKRFGPNAQVLSSPHSARDRKFYFEDLPPELQNVLRAQLRQAGDVSAVIEMPAAFVLYVAKERTAEIFTVATLSIPKRSYEQWVQENREVTPAP